MWSRYLSLANKYFFAFHLSPSQFTSEHCGSTKTCLRDPEGCNPENDTLCYFLSFRKVGQGVQFELSGPAAGYISFALSTDKWMVV